MGQALASFVKDQSGVTGIEYGVIALGVALAVISAADVMGHHLKLVLHIAAALTTKAAPTLH